MGASAKEGDTTMGLELITENSLLGIFLDNFWTKSTSTE